MSENVELDTSELFRKLKSWIDLNTDKDSLAPFYALAEVIQDRLDKSDLTEHRKGGILSYVFSHLAENNKAELAVFRDITLAMRERKFTTIH